MAPFVVSVEVAAVTQSGLRIGPTLAVASVFNSRRLAQPKSLFAAYGPVAIFDRIRTLSFCVLDVSHRGASHATMMPIALESDRSRRWTSHSVTFLTDRPHRHQDLTLISQSCAMLGNATSSQIFSIDFHKMRQAMK
jgi:hypothetical protein